MVNQQAVISYRAKSTETNAQTSTKKVDLIDIRDFGCDQISREFIV